MQLVLVRWFFSFYIQIKYNKSFLGGDSIPDLIQKINDKLNKNIYPGEEIELTIKKKGKM